MTHDDAGEDALAGIDLHVWRVPPPVEVHRPSLLVRALSPATPPKRSRVGWIVAAIVLVNAAIATLIVILLARPPATPSVVLPAGGSLHAKVRELEQRLEREQRKLALRLAEIRALREQVIELTEKVRQQDKRDRTVGPKRQVPDAIPPVLQACDEVSCILDNYAGACCVKYRSPRTRTNTNPDPRPASLDRAAISKAIASVRPLVEACADHSPAKGTVKVRVRVKPHGDVESVAIAATPDAALGACVAEVMERVTFERTRMGGSFSYPFVF
jgi:hypothetical protein